MKILLVPASIENTKATLINHVPIDLLKTYINKTLINDLLLSAIDGKINLFAVTETLSYIYNKIAVNDLAIFSVSGTNKFNYIGTIIGKTISTTLGRKLWPYKISKPWNYIYFLTDIKEIEVDKKFLLKKLGYSEKFELPKTSILENKRLDLFTKMYGDVLDYSCHNDNEDYIGDNDELKDFSADDVTRTGKFRIGHGPWAKEVKNNYKRRCAVCGLDDFLVSGHILSHAKNKEIRLNPRNGICLCSNHDKAFEHGYFSLDNNYKIILSPFLNRNLPKGKYLMRHEGKKIYLPTYGKPDLVFISKHRSNFGFK
ncbi:HNH endonuclease [Clostridium estertheticum]|uniref:HNH nuclease domain-containing protein n=1 Tax=Clostridium estertheticum TaxID=238834 RepID=A0A7Y3WTZ5_9CLOT|nr:HNH endonuclease [Clostridium estertheticum]NNU77564.1 hypothetical protein [Clostridium estertheticum]WBL48495.1 HNH endonuclease [Clostridium estertheticum]